MMCVTYVIAKSIRVSSMLIFPHSSWVPQKMTLKRESRRPHDEDGGTFCYPGCPRMEVLLTWNICLRLFFMSKSTFIIFHPIYKYWPYLYSSCISNNTYSEITMYLFLKDFHTKFLQSFSCRTALNLAFLITVAKKRETVTVKLL